MSRKKKTPSETADIHNLRKADNFKNHSRPMNESTHEPSTSTEVLLTPAELDAAAATLQALERFDEGCTEETGMWIFGYGSLCWLQGFNFDKSLTGFIRGFSRKFWQGNTTHRGIPGKPGRVVTLIEEEDGMVWGQAFQVKEKKAFSYLNNRECELGGYITSITTFYPRRNASEDKCPKPFPVILYIATPSNDLWLGDCDAREMARHIVESSGNSGHNVEYLLRLATFVHENIPEAVDDHLFNLERLVLAEVEKRKLCLKSLMGEEKTGQPEYGQNGGQEQELARGRTDTCQFSSTIPSKKLRCVNI